MIHQVQSSSSTTPPAEYKLNVEVALPDLVAASGYDRKIELTERTGSTLFKMLYQTHHGVKDEEDFQGKPVRAFYDGQKLVGLQPQLTHPFSSD